MKNGSADGHFAQPVGCGLLGAIDNRSHAVRQGVPHYIGTIVPVPDKAAKDFAHFFYTLLAAGQSIGEALGESRRVFAESRKAPIWGCYVHYGDPTYRFAVKPQMRSGAYEDTDETGRAAAMFFSMLGRSSKDEIQRMLEHYKTGIAKNPGDGEAYFASGLCYLQLGLHDLAVRHFKRAVDLMPDWSDAYYYYALSLIRGRRPKLLSLNEVRLIEQYLETALQLDDRPAKYYYLAGILKFDYYLANGLICRPPSPDELFSIAQGKEQDPWEMERLLNHVMVRDPELISRVRVQTKPETSNRAKENCHG